MIIFIICVFAIHFWYSQIKTGDTTVKQSFHRMYNATLATIEFQCFHPLIRTLVLFFAISLYANSSKYQDINWILYPLYTLIFSSISPVYIYLTAGEEANKKDGLNSLVAQTKNWVAVSTIISILISLSSIVLAHSEWWPTLIKFLSKWISINKVADATLITLLFICGLITNYIIYIISKFFLGSINQHEFNRNKR